jgi:hypothetical protein
MSRGHRAAAIREDRGMHDAFLVRLASVDDIPVITRHRAEMFSDMGQLPSTLYADLVTKSGAYLRQAIPAGEYTGWLASHSAEPREIIPVRAAVITTRYG